MVKHELFSKLPQLQLNESILVLTHTDLDGAGPAILLKSIYDKVEVIHCSNNTMSSDIKDAVLNKADLYDRIIVTDISCNEEDAIEIDKSYNKEKLILLDHHKTAISLNKYDWACVCSEPVIDSIRHSVINVKNDYQSSGTSLMYDFLDYCGLLRYIKNEKYAVLLADAISKYDTWDWVIIDNKEDLLPYKVNSVFSCYGIDIFEEIMIKRLKDDNYENGLFHTKGISYLKNHLLSETDLLLLEIESSKIKHHIENVINKFKLGYIETRSGQKYSIVLCNTGDYLSDVFEAMKEKYDVDLYIINYGTGFSIRTNRDSIDVGALVKPFGGGGHPGAGGVKINDRLLLALLESTTGSIVHID